MVRKFSIIGGQKMREQWLQYMAKIFNCVCTAFYCLTLIVVNRVINGPYLLLEHQLDLHTANRQTIIGKIICMFICTTNRSNRPTITCWTIEYWMSVFRMSFFYCFIFRLFRSVVMVWRWKSKPYQNNRGREREREIADVTAEKRTIQCVQYNSQIKAINYFFSLSPSLSIDLVMLFCISDIKRQYNTNNNNPVCMVKPYILVNEKITVKLIEMAFGHVANWQASVLGSICVWLCVLVSRRVEKEGVSRAEIIARLVFGIDWMVFASTFYVFLRTKIR